MVMLIAAAFSVSYAKWNATESAEIEVNDSVVGQFYVDYPAPTYDYHITVVFSDKKTYEAYITCKETYVNIWLYNTANGDKNYTGGTWPGLKLEKENIIRVSDVSSTNRSGFKLNFSFNSSASTQTTDLLFNNVFKDAFSTVTLTKTGTGKNDVTFTSTAQTSSPVEQTVRTVTATGTNAYHNYVSVSRIGGKGATIAYINFGVTSTNDLDKSIESFSVTRTLTDANGNPQAGSTEAVKVYNDPTGKSLDEINYIDGSKDTDPGVKDNNNVMPNYVLNGTYIMLYFNTGANQYYALDVVIETQSLVTFTLTATVTDVDKRNRFQDGYGYPYGYYLGGEFSGVNMWEPRRAARLTAAHTVENDFKNLSYVDDGVTVYQDVPKYIDVSIDIELAAANDTLKLYRVGSDGKYSGGEKPSLWFIPRNIYKNYSGGAGADGTDLFNKDMNIIIRTPGIYRLRFVGNIQYRDRDVNGNTSKSNGVFAYDREDNVFMSEDQYNALSTSQKNSTIKDESRGVSELRYVTLGNWNGVVEYLYVTRLNDSSTFSEVNVTFDPDGGTISGVTDWTEKVTWGSTLNSTGIISKTPTRTDGKTFDGWYDSNNVKYTKDTVIAPSTSTLTLTAKYKDASKIYTITFNANGGSVSPTSSQTGADGKLTSLPTPTRDYYTFDGWYPSTTGGTKITTDKIYDGDTEIYARWTARYVMVNGNTVTDLSGSGSTYSASQKYFSTNTTIYFYYGDSKFTLTRQTQASTITVYTNYVTTVSAGWYKFTLSSVNTSTMKATVKSEFTVGTSSSVGTGKVTVEVNGNWGGGGGGTWSGRAVASGISSGTYTLSFYIPKSTQFKIHSYGGNTEGWYGYNSGKHSGLNLWEYGSGGNWWNGDNGGIYTFKVTIDSTGNTSDLEFIGFVATTSVSDS
ncbi:MAG: InlB B-repeat-containing protein [Clostridiales bacterium]|nr:InlB B-repeat-containing protein [Clostridiales bacterium]